MIPREGGGGSTPRLPVRSCRAGCPDENQETYNPTAIGGNVESIAESVDDERRTSTATNCAARDFKRWQEDLSTVAGGYRLGRTKPALSGRYLTLLPDLMRATTFLVWTVRAAAVSLRPQEVAILKAP